jgi:hypothetical protein
MVRCPKCGAGFGRKQEECPCCSPRYRRGTCLYASKDFDLDTHRATSQMHPGWTTGALVLELIRLQELAKHWEDAYYGY